MDSNFFFLLLTFRFIIITIHNHIQDEAAKSMLNLHTAIEKWNKKIHEHIMSEIFKISNFPT